MCYVDGEAGFGWDAVEGALGGDCHLGLDVVSGGAWWMGWRFLLLNSDQ